MSYSKTKDLESIQTHMLTEFEKDFSFSINVPEGSAFLTLKKPEAASILAGLFTGLELWISAGPDFSKLETWTFFAWPENVYISDHLKKGLWFLDGVNIAGKKYALFQFHGTDEDLANYRKEFNDALELSQEKIR